MSLIHMMRSSYRLNHCKKGVPTLLLRSCSIRSYSNKTDVGGVDDDLDRPIKYTASPASKWKAQSSRSGVVGEPRLWYEPYVIMVSLTVFMVYFTMLREESDIDIELQRSLYSRIDGLEEKQLEIVLDYNRQHQLDTDSIEQRLNEIRQNKSDVHK